MARPVVALRAQSRRLADVVQGVLRNLAVILIGDCVHMTDSLYKNQAYIAAGWVPTTTLRCSTQPSVTRSSGLPTSLLRGQPASVLGSSALPLELRGGPVHRRTFRLTCSIFETSASDNGV